MTNKTDDIYANDGFQAVLNRATEKGDVEMIRYLAEKDDFNVYDKCGNLPIHVACCVHNLLLVEIIVDLVKSGQLKNCLNCSTKDKYWLYTPLMIAAVEEHIYHLFCYTIFLFMFCMVQICIYIFKL